MDKFIEGENSTQEEILDFIGTLCERGQRLLKRPSPYEFKSSEEYKNKTLCLVATRVSDRRLTLIFIWTPDDIKVLRETFLDKIFAGGFSINFYSLPNDLAREFMDKKAV
ncbi:MAG: hypothetical protein H7A25_12005 [Leptospiraceae bacterium]|nr:hypothetical protein [Leptospiraceae bacterium]